MTTFAIYRSEMTTSYPYDARGHRWAFAPIEGRQFARDGLQTGEVEAAERPLAAVAAPEGSRLIETEAGDLALLLPGQASGFSPRDAYLLACEGRFDLAKVEFRYEDEDAAWDEVLDDLEARSRPAPRDQAELSRWFRDLTSESSPPIPPESRD
jgi:hypothetical protein